MWTTELRENVDFNSSDIASDMFALRRISDDYYLPQIPELSAYLLPRHIYYPTIAFFFITYFYIFIELRKFKFVPSPQRTKCWACFPFHGEILCQSHLVNIDLNMRGGGQCVPQMLKKLKNMPLFHAENILGRAFRPLGLPVDCRICRGGRSATDGVYT